MSKTEIAISDNGKLLTKEWKQKKEVVKNAQADLYDVECRLYVEVSASLPGKGTTNFENGLKIVTGNTESFDQKELDRIFNNITAELRSFWPFSQVWKPEAKKIAIFMEDPSRALLLSQALTVKPRKPSFGIAGEKDDAE